MVSIVDIVPQTRTVEVASGELTLRGLGLRQIADLFLAFPSLRNLFTEGAPELTATELILQAPEAIGTIIAEAAGQPEAADAIAAGSLTPDEVLDCLVAIRDLTFPRGVGPLFERVGALMALAGAAGPPGKDQATNAPPLPNSLSPPDTLAAK